MTRRRIAETAGVFLQDAKKHRHEPAQALFDEKPVGMRQDVGRPQRLMRESVDHVLDQGGGPRRLDAVAGHIAYENGDASFLDFEHVVEVAADAGGLGGRAVEMAHLEGADLGGDVEKRLLELLRDSQLLLVEALVLRRQHPEPLLR